MSLPPKAVRSIVSEYQNELNQLDSTRLNPFLLQLTVQKIQTDLPLLLQGLNQHKNSKNYHDAYAELQNLSYIVDEHTHKTAKLMEKYSKEYATLEPVLEALPKLLPVPTSGDDYASLRKRLLADGTSSSLDNVATADQMNEYHETFQEDLMNDLSGLATALKNSAISLSSKIIDDSKILSTTNENMMKNLSLMQTVGANLNGYLDSKTGGKISIFFLIKTMAFIFFLTFAMIVLIKILPKM